MLSFVNEMYTFCPFLTQPRFNMARCTALDRGDIIQQRSGGSRGLHCKRCYEEGYALPKHD